MRKGNVRKTGSLTPGTVCQNIVKITKYLHTSLFCKQLVFVDNCPLYESGLNYIWYVCIFDTLSVF